MSAVSVSDTEVRTILAGAVDLARSALVDLEPTGVGAHLGVRAEDECSATHRFEATLPGYHGWQWAVVVAAAPDTDRVTVSESALLPGPDALIAPEFVPWEQRIRPGDLAPGDLLAPPADDPRLAPGYTATGDPEVDETAPEVGLGRKQVLSREGRAEAAERWYAEYGPDAEMAKAAPGSCASCGFYLPLAGALRACFGVCANAMGADGHVVHMGYGCGAHSDTQLPTGAGSPIYQAYDDAAVELVAVPPKAPEAGAASAAAAEADIAPDAVVPGQTVGAAPQANEPDAAGAPGSGPAAEVAEPAGNEKTAGSATAGPPADIAAESGTQGTLDAATESGTETVAQSSTGPVAESGSGPVAESGSGPVAESGSGPVAESGTGPVAESGTETVAESSSETVAESSSETVAQSNTGTVGESDSGPVIGPSPESVAESSPGPVAESSTGPVGGSGAVATSEPSAESVTESSSVPTAESGTGSVAEATSARDTGGSDAQSGPGSAAEAADAPAAETTGDPAAEADSETADRAAAGPVDTATAGTGAAATDEPVEVTTEGADPAEPGLATTASDASRPAPEHASAAAADPGTDTDATDRTGGEDAGTGSGEETAP
ncbi:DUF3027 domain-containing protein [Nocardia testacea]|uniref:DUF3027 domain-containing protein n=1 Tax=Nocardia testacea TaxID=248551 RepID=UPI003A850C77